MGYCDQTEICERIAVHTNGVWNVWGVWCRDRQWEQYIDRIVIMILKLPCSKYDWYFVCWFWFL